MKSNLILLMLLTLTFTLQGCLGEKGASNKRRTASTIKNTNDKATPNNPTFASDENLFWFTSIKTQGNLLINKNTTNIAYIRGSLIHNFLTSKDSTGTAYYMNGKNYCLAFNFSNAAFRPLRVRAVPISTNILNNAIERLFRIDFPNANDNHNVCGDINSATSPQTICLSANCDGLSAASSSSIRLYEAIPNSSATPIEIPSSQLNFSSLSLQVDLMSSVGDDSNLCSNSACAGKGFDCCVDGQCVKDATEKVNASTHPEYQDAKNAVALNPLNFILYPNIYNICANIPHNPPTTPTNPNDQLTEAQKRLELYYDDFLCINGIKTTGCKTAQTIKREWAIACGCPSNYDDQTMEAKCPNWGVKPIYNSSVENYNNVIDFYCYTPEPPNPIGPITNLKLNVSSRSAPHRFFDSTGKLHDSVSTVAVNETQEGTPFYYLDNINKATPESGEFNINTVLGSMNVNLSQAAPAQMVNVEIGTTYILSTISGYFTPCSSCAKDSWFSLFTAHPATANGTGLVASGYTTSRETTSLHGINANYEDTKFGRACYLPVTMIPFSHKKESNLQTQRQNRLTTQTAFYVNGYQRDWYGFNKGAMIGSFDGVTWFAVGTGRRITATSSKLYLAINAAHLDLAERNDHVVQIIPDLSGSVAPNYDYDPTLTLIDLQQNSAASCQKFHQCSTDSECVSQLGWEYTCADVSQHNTRWPASDQNANELAAQEISGSIFDILNATTTAGETTRRCVYRGAGAPCVRNPQSLSNYYNHKNLTCAPNFYCESLTGSNFNNQIARSPNEFDNVLFGMDANVLGRPLDYVTANKTLPTEVINNIRYNAENGALNLTSSQAQEMGICRPGKYLAGSYSLDTNIIAHANSDSNKRTDFINQISSCNSSLVGTNRTIQCPAFGEDLNYLPLQDTAASIRTRATQNMCGSESRYVSSISSTILSTFAPIEAKSLRVSRNILEKTLVGDACLRRAGTICHTDLDCGPNRLHSELADTLGIAYFGGTQAEQDFWRESLVCGQVDPLPQKNSSKYLSYQLSNNRCCREVGKNFTMHTAGPSHIVQDNVGSNENLNTRRLASSDPSANNRYSRYATSPTALNNSAAIPSITNITNSNVANPFPNQWKVMNETGESNCCGGGWIRKFADGTNNWKNRKRLSIDTENLSCLNYRSPLVNSSYSSFTTDLISYEAFRAEYQLLCYYLGSQGCMQILYPNTQGHNIIEPTPYVPDEYAKVDNPLIEATCSASYPTPGTPCTQPYTDTPMSGYTRIDTSPSADPFEEENVSWFLNRDVPYLPTAYSFPQYPYDLDVHDGDIDGKIPNNYFLSREYDYGVSMYLPAYVQYNPAGTFGVGPGSRLPSVSRIYLKYFRDGNPVAQAHDITDYVLASDTACRNVTTYPAPPFGSPATGQPIDALGTGDNEIWCITQQAETYHRPILHIKAYTGNLISPNLGLDKRANWKYAGIVIEFSPLETQKGTKVAHPGNPYYYLKQLGKLELLGIPQITYEPLYCNNDHDKVVPGIFKNELLTRTDFLDTNKTRGGGAHLYSGPQNITEYTPIASPPDYGNSEKRYTYRDKIDHDVIFSSKDFMCCSQLGKEVTNASKCCSGNAKDINGKLICMLPSGTNLSVYFNKFVSSEGVGADLPRGGLITQSADPAEVDFDVYTGEPKMRESTYLKLEALGATFCESNTVVNGGAFGPFAPQPNASVFASYSTGNSSTNIEFPMSIVDSIYDQAENAGKAFFDQGYRWDHHYYCK